MDKHLTAHGIRYGTRCRKVGDFVFLPEPSTFGVCKTAAEVRRDEAYEQGIEGDFGDVFHIIPFQLTGLPYVVCDNGPVVATLRASDLFRLQNVRQLGTLIDPVMFGIGQPTMPFRFAHNRYVHSLDVAAIATAIAWNSGVSERERLHLTIACIIHDALTPAHGDGTKLLDPKAFDEDLHIKDLFDRPGWPKLRATYDLSEQLLIDIVQERGVLGAIKKWADRIAYTARDVMAFAFWDVPSIKGLQPYEHQVVRMILRTRPNVLHIWDKLRVMRGQLVCTDPDALADFLRLRVQMFQSLYYHPFARFREFVFSTVVVKYLYDTGKVTREQLLTMTDDELDQLIDKTIGASSAIDKSSSLGTPHAQCFKDEWSMRDEEARLRASGLRFILIEVLERKINPGIDFPVRVERRTIPLSEARPQVARDIKQLARIEFPYRLYWLENPRVSAEFDQVYDHYTQTKAAR